MYIIVLLLICENGYLQQSSQHHCYPTGLKWSLDLDGVSTDVQNDAIALLRTGLAWLRSNLQVCLEVYGRKALVKVRLGVPSARVYVHMYVR